GTYRWHLNRAVPLRNVDGRIICFVGTSTDIEELKLAQEKLRQSELNLRLMTETIPEMLWSATPRGDIDYCNARLLDYTGVPAEEIIGAGWKKLLHPKGMAQPFGVDFENGGDGQTIFLDVNADAVRQNGDVPDRPIRLAFERAGERESKTLWKLNSVAELAPGVASRALDRLPETPERNAPWPN
ncbi:MAG: PAS domain-containing protein, partial [Candidatus Acidiferrales bacterium]